MIFLNASVSLFIYLFILPTNLFLDCQSIFIHCCHGYSKGNLNVKKYFLSILHIKKLSVVQIKSEIWVISLASLVTLLLVGFILFFYQQLINRFEHQVVSIFCFFKYLNRDSVQFLINKFSLYRESLTIELFDEVDQCDSSTNH